MHLKKIIFMVIFLVAVNSCGKALAEEALFYKEINLIGGYSAEDRWITQSSTLSNSLGFEDYRKFSNEYGDFLTTDLQVRAPYYGSEPACNAFGVEIHNAWAAYKLSLGHNLKVGHFDPEFGLEPTVDTHSTILQTLMMKSIGFKKDWGVALEGFLANFDYRAALQLGSGMSVRVDDENYLATARLGAGADKNFQYGFSFLWGQVLESKGMMTIPRSALAYDKAILKRRMEFDLRYFTGPYEFKGEVAFGKDFGNYALGYMVEADYTLPKQQNCELSLQLESWMDDLNKRNSADTTIAFCVSYKVNQKVTVRAFASRDLKMANGEEDTKILMQVYYYAG